MGREKEIGEPQRHGLRFIRDDDALLFAAWESVERPYPWSTAQFQQTALTESPMRVLVLENDEVVLGYAALNIVQDEAYLSNIMVSPARRRKGFGATLLQKVIMWAISQGSKEMALDVDASNQPAIELYKKCGFTIVQRRKGSYPRGEDALLMRKKI